MPPSVRTNRARDRLAGKDFTVIGVSGVVFHKGDRERENDPRGSQVGVDFDLGGSVAFAQLVEDGINVWFQTLVGLPGNPPRNDEIPLSTPEVVAHTQ